MGAICYTQKRKYDKICKNKNNNSYIINENFSQNKEKNTNNKKEYIYEDLLKKHNEYRNKYGAPDLELNDELCQLAQECADKCADFQNTDLNPVSYKDVCIGENISEFEGDISTASKICEEWAREISNFYFRKKEYKEQAKHFTQMIWKNTQSVGFGFSSSSNGKNYFVSLYFPAGNIFDEFDKNIPN